MRKVVFALTLAVLASCDLPAFAGTLSTTTTVAADLASHIEGLENKGEIVRFVLPAASRSWTECPVYGCYPVYPGGPVLCIDPPEPGSCNEECDTFSEVVTYSVVSETP